VISCKYQYFLCSQYNHFFRVGQIINVPSQPLSFVPEIGSVLSGAAQVSAQVLQKADYDRIKDQLKEIGSVGDVNEQIEVAQLVA